MKEKLRKNWLIIAIVLIFFLSRFLAFGQMYHQDEYKWVMIVDPSYGLNYESDHPPLVGLLYHIVGVVSGYDHLRLLPIAVSSLLLLGVFFLASKLYGKKAAWWTVGILFISTYNFIASTQVDIDGALLPLASVIAIYCFYRIDFSNIRNKKQRLWIIAFIISIIFGFLIKLSFALVLGALITEYCIRKKPSKKLVLISTGIFVGIIAILAIIVLIMKYVLNIEHAVRFIQNVTKFGFLNFSSRDYFQVLFLGTKSLVLASPLLLGLYILVFSSREYIRRYRFWIIFLLYNVLFYFVIFDFTNRTIERYMMFLIIPSSIIAGSILAEKWRIRIKDLSFRFYGVVSFFVIITFIPFLYSYAILPLYPKSSYIEKLKSLDFDFLIPITGGSGPIGFYMLVSYVVVAFMISLGSILTYRLIKKESHKKIVLVVFLLSSLAYNLVLNEEFLFGKIYGSVNKIAFAVTNEVVGNSEIDKVVTYYDIAGYELNDSKKYARRFYVAPMFAQSNVGKFTGYSGYYSVVGFPLIDPTSIYWRYLQSCKTVFQSQDKNIRGYIFDCKNGDKNIFN
ncbi:MAG: glycosyltransferase family 39 protein [Patescibacteria group bacterium]|nr:glycosyltransferase family 39 protein [Patescibacteria group bacterium]